MSTFSPRVVAILPRLCPSTWINIVKPLVALHEAGRVRAWVTLESMASPRDVDKADLLVFCRNVRPDRAELLRAAITVGVPVLYDLDDNFFELPPDSASGRAFAQPEQLAMLTEYLTAASLVRVYSRPLLASAGRLNSHVEMVAGAVDLHQVRQPAKLPGGPVKLIYATSRLDDSLGRIFLPALRRLMDEEGPRVEAHFWGPRPPAELPAVRHHGVVHNYDRFLRRFSAAGFEIGLAPLADDVFHRSKTNTKFREYGACGIAGIYSDVEVYSDCVRHGETGLLVANDAEAWYRALRQLVDDANLRKKIQQQARLEIENHYSQEIFESVFLRQIEQLVGRVRPQRIIETHAVDARLRQPRLARLVRLIPQGIGCLRRKGWARCWNALRWIGSSSWSMACLQWRLRKGWNES
ncbi:MAG: glycosyltransferase [Planctomycetota bacterium]